MRIASIKTQGVKPIQLFEVSDLNDVVVIAGPNGVGKSRLVNHLLNHLRDAGEKDIRITLEATDKTESQIWGKATLNTSELKDMRYLTQMLRRNHARSNYSSSILYFESNRSIQVIQPLQPSWKVSDPDNELLSWDFGLGGLRDRFNDTIHAIFRKVKGQEIEIGRRAQELKKRGDTLMPLDFNNPLDPFKDVFSRLLGPKILNDVELEKQTLTYLENGTSFTIDNLSSGEKEVLNITFDFLLRSPSHCIVFLDEPELHLHPELSFRLLTTLRSIGTKNQFILCTHSPDIISATLDQSVVFIAPPKSEGPISNQAIVVNDNDDTNQALRLLGHSIGIVALGRKIVLIEGTHSSLDKQTYGSILRWKFPSLVLLPAGGKQTLQTFNKTAMAILNKSLWGVEFFMLCDGDTSPSSDSTFDLESISHGRLRVLPKYHLENYFLDEEILSALFVDMEPSEHWLRSPKSIRGVLRDSAHSLVSYTVALMVAQKIRLAVGNIDILPDACHGKSSEDLTTLFAECVASETTRVADGLDASKIKGFVKDAYEEIQTLLAEDNNGWKDRLPGRPILSMFAARAKLDVSRIKTMYLQRALLQGVGPFQEIIDIFSDFERMGQPTANPH